MDPIITSALTAFATTIATNSSKGPMQTLDDLWYLAFGKLNQFADLKRAKHEVDTTHYKDSLARKLIEIKEENLQEPPMSVVGPALEASKFYIEEKELREMFSNVISASMDKSKSNDVHHCFVEIIKQLSPRDARNLSNFKYNPTFPIAEYRLRYIAGNGYKVLKTMIFSSNPGDILNDIDERDATSISNLIRLGLLSYSFIEQITNDTAYIAYEQGPYIEHLKKEIDQGTYEIEVQRGLVSSTPLGKSFVSICM